MEGELREEASPWRAERVGSSAQALRGAEVAHPWWGQTWLWGGQKAGGMWFTSNASVCLVTQDAEGGEGKLRLEV